MYIIIIITYSAFSVSSSTIEISCEDTGKSDVRVSLVSKAHSVITTSSILPLLSIVSLIRFARSVSRVVKRTTSVYVTFKGLSNLAYRN